MSVLDYYDLPIAALEAFVKAQVVDTQNTAPNGMCMLAKTLGELTEDNQDLIDITKTHLGEISMAFVNLIEQAQQLNEVDSTKNAQELANHVQIQIAGLRTFAKINHDQALLLRKISDIFQH